MEKKTLTAEDLGRVFIRAQGADSGWMSISVADCTDTQFDSWARSRVPIEGDGPWSVEERVRFCDFLWQNDALAMLIKD